MKIAIDISQVVYGTGVSVYTKELVRSLLKVSPEHNYILYAGVLRRRSDIDKYLDSLSGNFRSVILPIPPKAADVLWNSVRAFPIETFIGPFDVLHTSDWTEPRSRAPKITTIHDLSPILYPEVTNRQIRQVFEKKIKLVKKDNDTVIVPSLIIEDEVLKLNISKKQVFVIPEAPNPELLNAPVIDIKSRFNIENKFILMVGTAPRKNVERSIEAFHSAKLEQTQLVIVGDRSGRVQMSSDVIYTGFVTTEELANLYKNAEVFLYTSLYEGFGIPLLEAYELGCPVVTSNIGSMKELGSAAILVNPMEQESIMKGIRDAILQHTILVKKGKEFVRKYSWDETARKTLEVYKKAYEER